MKDVEYLNLDDILGLVRALGIGPVGAAFFAWDIGMKRGDIRVLGAASYATPLLSTGFLMLAGFATLAIN